MRTSTRKFRSLWLVMLHKILSTIVHNPSQTWRDTIYPCEELNQFPVRRSRSSRILRSHASPASYSADTETACYFTALGANHQMLLITGISLCKRMVMTVVSGNDVGACVRALLMKIAVGCKYWETNSSTSCGTFQKPKKEVEEDTQGWRTTSQIQIVFLIENWCKRNPNSYST